MAVIWRIIDEGHAVQPPQHKDAAEIKPPAVRKIIHIDMDAFFASVEQRDNPEWRGKPLAVGGASSRSVVAAASYEARKFGVKSAMPSVKAQRLCPNLIFAPPRFEAYRAISQQIRAIFAEYTDMIEPLSLDEAYLDVTENKPEIASATMIAEEIRAKIFAQTGLTASAGISYNKFIAKIASDQNKPNGICVIPPEKGADFVAQLPVRRFHGVGPKTAEKMAALGIETGADLREKEQQWLTDHFGKSGGYLYHAARAIDHRPVRADRVRKSIGGERTWREDIWGEDALKAKLEEIIAIVWPRIERHDSKGRTVTLKLRFGDFQSFSRARSTDTPHDYIDNAEDFATYSRALLDEILPLDKGVRLMGLTLSNLYGADQDDNAQKTAMKSQPSQLSLPF